MSEGKVYEMLWDCEFCGTKGNLGLTHRFCPNCGAPQNPASRYYPSDEDKVEVHDHKYVGVDVTCPACNELNSAAAEFCGQCGSPLTEGAKAKVLEAQSRDAGGSFESSGSRDIVKEKFDVEMELIGVKQPNKPKRQPGGLNVKVLAIVAVVIAVIGAIAYFFMASKETDLIVTGHQWERSMDIQEYRNFSVRDWQDSRPSGDNVQMGSCSRQQRSTRRIPDGQECHTVRRDQGDGTYREEQQCQTKYREEPVYDSMCTWTGQRWESERTAKASGDLNDTPAWPGASLNCEGQSRVGCERISNRQEHYWALFKWEDNHNGRCDYPQTEWQSIPVESLWKGSVGRFVDNIRCDTLTRQ